MISVKESKIDLNQNKNMENYHTDRCVNCPIRSKIYCNCLDAEDLEDLSKSAQHKDLNKKVIVMSMGDEIKNIYNILNGIIKIYQLSNEGKEQIIGFLYPGDFFGSHEGGQYQFFAETISEVRLCKIPIQKFRKHINKNDDIRDKFYEAATNELSLAREQINMLAKYNAEEKVLDFIKMISQRQTKHGQPHNPVYLIMARADIANYLGLRIESVSRAITKLKVKKNISINEHGFIILNEL